ncbi:MAG: hypothetical protein WCL23_03825 [Candidatus Moraniibacteriota bacterium]
MWRKNTVIEYRETPSADVLREMIRKSLPEVFPVGGVVEVTIATPAFLDAISKPSSDPKRTVWDLMPVLYVEPFGQGHNGLTLGYTGTVYADSSQLAESIVNIILANESEWKSRYIGWSAAYHSSKNLITCESDIAYVLRTVRRKTAPWLYVSFSRK